ncbi:MAG TPA: alpha/beta hydrolase [Flavitalea sp.]|nr:alpha/beta hydrolase [Flavitalea sp.]
MIVNMKKQLLFALSACMALAVAAQEEDSLTIQRNIRYAATAEEFKSDTSSDRLLDIYKPVNSSATLLPVVVFVHGGGFSKGDKQGTASTCRKIAGLGYAVLSINYRLELKLRPSATAITDFAAGTPADGKFNPALKRAIAAASEDAVLALAWVKDNADKYGLDASRVVIGGGSAGAITALHTAYASRQNVLPVKAVINFWGGLENADVIGENAPPVITFHGDKDHTVRVDYAYAIEKAMKKNGNILSETHILPGLGHALYDFVGREKLNEIDAFLKKVLKTGN